MAVAVNSIWLLTVVRVRRDDQPSLELVMLLDPSADNAEGAAREPGQTTSDLTRGQDGDNVISESNEMLGTPFLPWELTNPTGRQIDRPNSLPNADISENERPEPGLFSPGGGDA